jgi:DNA invertase Pin-like site-specific DNA recombinase
LRPGDIIITAKLDRMFRSATDALANLDRMKRESVSLHMIDLGGDVTGNGIARLVFTILSAVAEAERDRIRERIITVKADQAARGRFLGGDAKFGYCVEPEFDGAGNRKGGRLIEDPDQQAAIAKMCAMHQDGKSLRAIAAAIEADGHKLSLMSIRRIVNQAAAARTMTINHKCIEAEYRRLAHTLGWRFLTCPERNILTASVALVSINPGGDKFEPAKWSVENGNAYKCERWDDNLPGQAPLQQQVQRMFDVMDVKLADVLSGYLVPFRSPEWSKLPKRTASIDFGVRLWREVFKQATNVETVIAFGKETAEPMIDILQARAKPKEHRAEWSEQTIDEYRFGSNRRLVVLPHLSQFRLFSRDQSERAFREACDRSPIMVRRSPAGMWHNSVPTSVLIGRLS